MLPVLLVLLPGGPGIFIAPGGGGRIPIGPPDTLFLSLFPAPCFFCKNG